MDRHLPLLVILLSIGAACARGQSDYVGEPGQPSGAPAGAGAGAGAQGGDGLGVDATAPVTGPGGSDGGAPPADGAAPTDGGSPPPQDAAIDAPFDAGAMDPELGLPDPNGPPCSRPGSENGCPGITVCRIATPDGGRCEGCTNCGNLHSPCTASNECDILFQCYQGFCMGICQLGTYECGAIADCVNVGNATEGVCRP